MIKMGVRDRIGAYREANAVVQERQAELNEISAQHQAAGIDYETPDWGEANSRVNDALAARSAAWRGKEAPEPAPRPDDAAMRELYPESYADGPEASEPEAE